MTVHLVRRVSVATVEGRTLCGLASDGVLRATERIERVTCGECFDIAAPARVVIRPVDDPDDEGPDAWEVEIV